MIKLIKNLIECCLEESWELMLELKLLIPGLILKFPRVVEEAVKGNYVRVRHDFYYEYVGNNPIFQNEMTLEVVPFRCCLLEWNVQDSLKDVYLCWKEDQEDQEDENE